jgi:formiminotetrahydrofolate cyclodeaminase
LLADLKIGKFLEKTVKRNAVSGGANGAALNAVMAASLAEMVTNLTVGKKGHEAVEKQMKEILAMASKLKKSG